MDDVLKIAGILVVIVFCGAFVAVDWQMVLTGEESEIQVEVSLPDAPEPEKVDPVPDEPVFVPVLNLELNINVIDWGVLVPGAQKNVSVLLTNTGNIPCELYVSAVNWDPPDAEKFLVISWDLEGACLEPGSTIGACLVLNVDPQISVLSKIEAFSMDIVVHAVGILK